MQAGAAALKVASRADNFDESMAHSVRGWSNLFQGIWHIFVGCGIPADCSFCKLRRPSAKTSIMRVRKAFERVAFPTLITLRKESQYRHLWKHLIKFFGITFESTRRRYQLDKKCCSMFCTSRNSGHRSETRRICLGCLTVFYCDRDCQARYALLLICPGYLALTFLLATGIFIERNVATLRTAAQLLMQIQLLADSMRLRCLIW